jgi:putative colanic acid biosynthesis UDP-glucose lipid carrier transferase
MNKTTLVTNENAQPDLNTPSFKETPDFQEVRYENTTYQTSLKLVYANSPLEKEFNYILKRGVDILLSSLLILFLLSWLIPIIAFLIKSDSPGPVFFLQKRNKKDGGIFTCIKFRSMVVNKEADKLAAFEDDERITPIGKFLRRHHLDELPQLFNVLYGDMSIIGPRPHMLIENINYEKLVQEYACRHQVKPGITGLAQSLGHYGYTMDLQKIKERVDIDLVYIKHWSIKMDIQIMLRTFRMIFGI